MTFASQHAHRSMPPLVLTSNTRKLKSNHNFWKLKDPFSCMLVTISCNGWFLCGMGPGCSRQTISDVT
jgi:hypothetical protein